MLKYMDVTHRVSNLSQIGFMDSQLLESVCLPKDDKIDVYQIVGTGIICIIVISMLASFIIYPTECIPITLTCVIFTFFTILFMGLIHESEQYDEMLQIITNNYYTKNH